jgi:hypothetical protein
MGSTETECQSIQVGAAVSLRPRESCPCGGTAGGIKGCWQGALGLHGNEARGGCLALAPVAAALRFNLGGLRGDGLLDASIYRNAVHGSFDAQLSGQSTDDRRVCYNGWVGGSKPRIKENMASKYEIR